MNAKLIALLSLPALLAVTDARADVVSERVALTPFTNTCGSNATGFRRVTQMPDGSETVSSTEFQVPYGSYLEITSIEYTTPYWTAWAGTYVQSLDFNIRQRSGTRSTNVLAARYQNQSTYVEEGDRYVPIGQVAAPGARTHVATFPVGPLMSYAGRLCLSTSSQYWTFGGQVRVRGRLIPSGEPGMTAPSDSTKVQ